MPRSLVMSSTMPTVLTHVCTHSMYSQFASQVAWLPTQPFPLGWDKLSLPIKPKCSSSSLINIPFPEEGGYCPELSDPLSSSTWDEYTRNHTSQTHSSCVFCSGHHQACGPLLPFLTWCPWRSVLFRNGRILEHLCLGFSHRNTSTRQNWEACTWWCCLNLALTTD